MSKNVKVNGVTYNGVNSVKLQAADGGEAIFYAGAPYTYAETKTVIPPETGMEPMPV